ncbi:MAG: 5'/3'-nucleotidase SurE [Planctomycetaceae bacterium]
MQILLTNDDGIYAPGLEAMSTALERLGRVVVVAPMVEQSGVSHSITYLEPLIVHDVRRGDRFVGHAVSGSPADCVKVGVLELCRPAPDLVVSGINAGANSGINVLYSGTVAGAIEGSFFGITSVAVSLGESDAPDYATAARQAVRIIEQLLGTGVPRGSLWNVNLPPTRAGWPVGVKALPMGLERHGEAMQRRTDPRGRTYYWSMTDPDSHRRIEPGTDVEALAEGYATITPLHIDLTDRQRLNAIAEKQWTLGE